MRRKAAHVANETGAVDIVRIRGTKFLMNVHPTHAEIDLKSLRHNLGVVRSTVGPAVKIMAVVKSNAYGHGVLQVANEAMSAGAEYLAVARVDEGVELRDGGVSIPLLVFELVADHQIATVLRKDMDFTVASRSGAEKIARMAAESGKRARVHVKVDTGMGRIGIAPDDAPGVIEEICGMSSVEIIAVWSHFATADSHDKSYAMEQLAKFRRVLEKLEERNIRIPLRHMANSAAILTMPQSHFDMVRPGIVMYGLAPGREIAVKAGLKPVMSLRSRVSFLKTVPAGAGISYGRSFVTENETRIATVPVGYADGYSRIFSNRANVLIRGKQYPVVGTVCMDHLMVDVGIESDVAENDPVILIGSEAGEEISCWDLAELRGTIPYEIMCAVSARVPRVVR